MTKLAAFYRARLPAIFTACALMLSLWQFGAALTIAAKAVVAQRLIEHAWQQTLQMPELHHKPWRWADTWPVLQLQWHQHNAWHSTYVLASAAGASLAFGPGVLEGSALPGLGTTVLAAHRDTHFAFLANAKAGDVLRVQNVLGKWFEFEITTRTVVDTRVTPLQIDPDANALVLVTCYPFDALSAGGPLRLVVEARSVHHSSV